MEQLINGPRSANGLKRKCHQPTAGYHAPLIQKVDNANPSDMIG